MGWLGHHFTSSLKSDVGKKQKFGLYRPKEGSVKTATTPESKLTSLLYYVRMGIQQFPFFHPCKLETSYFLVLDACFKHVRFGFQNDLSSSCLRLAPLHILTLYPVCV